MTSIMDDGPEKTLRDGEMEHLCAVLDRYDRLSAILPPRHVAAMDLMNWHEHDRLRFDLMAKMSDVDFAHDIAGIMNHMDRVNGRPQEGNVFSPRCAERWHGPMIPQPKEQR